MPLASFSFTIIPRSYYINKYSQNRLGLKKINTRITFIYIIAWAVKHAWHTSITSPYIASETINPFASMLFILFFAFFTQMALFHFKKFKVLFGSLGFFNAFSLSLLFQFFNSLVSSLSIFLRSILFLTTWLFIVDHGIL